MPRDKTESHEKIMAAAKKEFLEKGFEKASIRSIASRAGLTSAALYRHFSNKEEMFAALVNPGIRALEEWQQRHSSEAYENVEKDHVEQAASRSEVDMMREVVMPYRDSFKLILCCSQSTRYEHFVHNLVEKEQKEMRQAIESMKERGFPVMEISDEGLHMLLSAYFTALFEPVIHDYPSSHTEDHLALIEKFFMPGWHEVLGI